MRDLDGGDGAIKYGIDAPAGHPSDKGAVAYMVYEIRYTVPIWRQVAMIAVAGFVARNHVFPRPAAIIRQEPPPWIKSGSSPASMRLANYR